MAKAKKNATRSGNKQRKHTKQHLTKEQLLEQRVKALSRRILIAERYTIRSTHNEQGHGGAGLDLPKRVRDSWHYAPKDQKQRIIVWHEQTTPAAPSFTIDEV